MTTLNPKELIVETDNFFTPTLQEAADVLREGLKYNYNEVEVEVVECPDLTKPPFNLASSGLGGKPRLIEVGGPSYTAPVDYTKHYDLIDLPHLVDLDPAFVFGASIGCETVYGANAEAIVNINIDNNDVNQKSKVCKLGETNGSFVLEDMGENETRYSFLGSFFASEGKPGPVLKVHVRKRIGGDSFVKSIRKVLKTEYEDNVLGLGGTFLIKKGQVRQHLIPGFPEEPLYTEAQVNNWFKFFTMSAPLTAIGILATGDLDLELRHFHFHTFSDHGDAGHYRIDTTPEIIEYEGYFNIAECAYRIDRPHNTKTYQKKF